MSFQLHNTLGGKEPVVADDGLTLRFYCYGPTVYGPAHIGNFLTFVVQDLFRRVAEAHGLATCHMRNLTDVDDKTIRQSQAEGTTLAAFCARWTARFHRDCAALNLLAPHHENEIAQSEAATGRPFVHYWFHVAHLFVDGGKMSKSLGNLYTLEDIVARGHTPAELRLALLSGHYRQPLNFTWNSLHAARP